MAERSRDLAGDVAAIALGIALFLLYNGWWGLIPTNISWVSDADRAMHQLGWMFFREAPWGIPPGASPLLGIELANSIALVDGLPLFAIPFKLIEQWLPQPFQYWGYWRLLCFVLQAFFGYRIARELGARRAIALFTAAFVIFTPAFLFRVPIHMALSGHWTVLAGLYLYIKARPPRLWTWPLLVGATAAIHATLLAMVLGLWFAALIQRLWLARIDWRAALVEAVGVAALCLAVLWTVGFFMVGSYDTYGYGDYKLNLLWPILKFGWSSVMPDLPHGRLDYEGMSFLGIGVLALLVVAILTGAIARVRAAITPRWLPLLGVMLVMMGFAFSKTIGFGNVELLHLEMPGLIEALGAAFRSTGRFIWPLLYTVTISIVVLAGMRLRLAVAVPLMLVALFGQMLDSAPAWRKEIARYPSTPASTWRTPLISPFWERAADAGFNRIRGGEGMFGDWRNFGYFAVLHGMDTDAVYLARIDKAARARHDAMLEEQFATGAFEPHTLYAVDVPRALQVMQHLAPGDLLAIIDGYVVFARNGAGLIEGLDIENTTRNGGSWVPTVSQGGSLTD